MISQLRLFWHTLADGNFLNVAQNFSLHPEFFIAESGVQHSENQKFGHNLF